MFGPVLGAVAAYTGTGSAFGVVGSLSLLLAFAAWRMPAATPEQPQPLEMLFRALSVRKIQLGVWFTLLAALLFGNLSVLGPLRLSELGWGAVAIGATYLVSAAIEAVWAPVVGHASDRYGRMPPMRLAVLGSAVVCALLPWPHNVWAVALLIICGGFVFGSFWTPALSLVTDEAERFGLDYGYAFALVNIAWAPGQAGGAAIGGLLAAATSDAVPYLTLGAMCLATFLTVFRYRETAAPLAAER
jgi:MFS family permease